VLKPFFFPALFGLKAGLNDGVIYMNKNKVKR